MARVEAPERLGSRLPCEHVATAAAYEARHRSLRQADTRCQWRDPHASLPIALRSGVGSLGGTGWLLPCP